MIAVERSRSWSRVSSGLALDRLISPRIAHGGRRADGEVQVGAADAAARAPAARPGCRLRGRTSASAGSAAGRRRRQGGRGRRRDAGDRGGRAVPPGRRTGAGPAPGRAAERQAEGTERGRARWRSARLGHGVPSPAGGPTIGSGHPCLRYGRRARLSLGSALPPAVRRRRGAPPRSRCGPGATFSQPSSRRVAMPCCRAAPGDLLGRGAGDRQPLDLLGHRHHLVQGHPAAVAGAAAGGAAAGPVERRQRRRPRSTGSRCRAAPGPSARRAAGSARTASGTAAGRARRRAAEPTRNGSMPISTSRVTADGRVVGVQRGEHQVAGERGLDGDLGGLVVADLADQHDVGVASAGSSAAPRRRSGRPWRWSAPG